MQESPIILNHKDHTQVVHLLPEDNRRLASFCGECDEHLRLIETRLGVSIKQRGFSLRIVGSPQAAALAKAVAETLYAETATTAHLTQDQVHLCLRALPASSSGVSACGAVIIHAGNAVIKPQGSHQAAYVAHIGRYDVNFGIGPSGTGKTYLAVACAVEALQQGHVERIILVRPAVEAGENLGFLPGGLEDKVDPYLRPLYDALYAMLGFEKVSKLIEQHVIEIAPLAFMRGRTLNHAFIILDESQNTTCEQMKMFLTRVGFGAKVVVTGDVTQIDLPRGKVSGLSHAIEVLKAVDGICFSYFEAKDIVRHAIVQRIVEAYERDSLRHHDNTRADQ